MINKNILYIGGFELPDKNAAAQRVIANAKILKELGYNVYFISVDKSIKKGISINNTQSIYEGFIYYKIEYPISLTSWITYLTSIKNIIALEKINFSFIIAYNYPSLALFNLTKYCSKKKIHLMADCTEWYEATEGNILYRIIKRLDTSFRMKKIHPKMDGIIVISKYLYNYYINNCKKVLLLPPLVDLSMNKWTPNIQLKKDVFTLIYAGSPGSGQKDRIDKIIKAISKIKELYNVSIIFNIIGLTPHNYYHSFGLESLPSNIDGCIFFKGRMSHSDTLQEISNADFVIFIRDINLTNTAGFPTKFVESISCGTPVLTNSTSNINDYLVEGKNGFIIDARSEQTLVKTLYDAIIIDKKLILEMKKYCKESHLFNYKKYINQFKLFIEK